ncbi:MAG: phosphoribosyl-AMP cyclohydrolase [Hyphomicrobiaceae bacterium]
MDRSAPFAARGAAAEIENGLTFQPKFDGDGLIPAIVTDAAKGDVLMMAWMNAEALALTIATGHVHFWSRSRGKLWKKGEDSGNVFTAVDMRTDCDQDAIWLSVDVAGSGAACHTGRHSCFYRRIPLGRPPTPDLALVPTAP